MGHSDDENAKESQSDGCEVLSRDVEARRRIDTTSSVDREEMHSVDLAKDLKFLSLVKATEKGVSVEACDHDATSRDVKNFVDSELRQPTPAHVRTDDTKFSQNKEVSLGGGNKLDGDSMENRAEAHGLRKQRGTKAGPTKPSAGGDSGLSKMPEEYKKGVTITRTEKPLTDVGQEARQKKLVVTKTRKKGKSKGIKRAGEPSALREAREARSVEESQLRAKKEAETDKKVYESFDKLMRQTIRCEPYKDFADRRGNEPLQRLRPDVFENHVAGEFARGFSV